LPAPAVEPGHLDLLDRDEICWAGVDLDPWQHHRHPEMGQIRSLLHDVFSRQIIAALLRHLHQSSTKRRTDNIAGIGLVARREIFVHKATHSC
jgi:hypothetical protein